MVEHFDAVIFFFCICWCTIWIMNMINAIVTTAPAYALWVITVTVLTATIVFKGRIHSIT